MGLGEMGLGEMVLGEMVLGDMDIHRSMMMLGMYYSFVVSLGLVLSC
jgi:hypothetical protein